MNFYFLLVILKKTLIFWLFNFVVGFPLAFLLGKKIHRKFIGIVQLCGLSTLSIVLSWMNFLGFKQNTFYIFVSLVIASLLFLFFILLRAFWNRTGAKKIFLDIFILLKTDFYQYLIYVLFVVIFVFPQKTFPPFIPSYEVNHDPIPILIYSKSIFGNEKFVSIETNYPLGFSSLLNFSSPPIALSSGSSSLIILFFCFFDCLFCSKNGLLFYIFFNFSFLWLNLFAVARQNHCY